MRLQIVVALTLIFSLVSLSTVLHSRTIAEATASPNQNTRKLERKMIQPDLPGTVSGTASPESIPDTIAYELFMRSISDYPSASLLQDIGLHDDQIANAMNYLSSFEQVISLFDREARSIKKAGNGSVKLKQLQRKEGRISRTRLESAVAVGFRCRRRKQSSFVH